MPTNNPSADNPPQDAVDAVGAPQANGANEARDAISSVATTAADKVDEGRETAANGLDSAASTVHDRADELPGGAKVKELAHAAADRLGTTADYVRSHDATRMMTDLDSLVKNNPGPALVVAAALGFLLARALSRD